jgi:hypothetical protein
MPDPSAVAAALNYGEAIRESDLPDDFAEFLRCGGRPTPALPSA